MSKFLIHNGELERIDSFHLKGIDVFSSNLYVTETVRLYNTKPLFLDEHIAYLIQALNQLQIRVPDSLFDLNKISRYITRLLNVNKVYKGGECKISVNIQSELFIFIDALPNLDFTYNTEGIHVGIASHIQYFPPIFHSKVTGLSLYEYFSELQCEINDYNAVTIQNIDGLIFTSNIGDILFVENDILYCADSVLNPIVHPITKFCIYNCKLQKIQVKEVAKITEKQLLNADECFIINPLNGIQWISKINDSVYGYKLSKRIHLILLKAIAAIQV